MEALNFGSYGCRFEPCRVQIKSGSRSAGDFRRLADQFLGCASHLIVTLKTKLERKLGPIAPAWHLKAGSEIRRRVFYRLIKRNQENRQFAVDSLPF
jgi:hypothetical protein